MGRDLQQIDTEGYDHKLVNALDLNRNRPRLICFEKIHIPTDELGICLGSLRSNGYCAVSSDMDILAYDEG